MIREKPYPLKRGKLTPEQWAVGILRLWMKDGYPELLGPPAEQVSIARRLTAWDDRRKPARKGTP